MSGKRILRPWLGTEVLLLRRQYGNVPIAALAAKLGRSVGCVQATAQRIGLATPRKDWKKICADHKPTFALR